MIFERLAIEPGTVRNLADDHIVTHDFVEKIGFLGFSVFMFLYINKIYYCIIVK